MIINPFAFGGAPPPAPVYPTWDATESVNALFQDDTTAPDAMYMRANSTGTGTYANTRSTQALEGKSYFSARVFHSAVSGASSGCGVADATLNAKSSSVWCGSTNTGVGVWLQNGIVYFNGASTGFNVGAGVSAEMEFAVDVPNRKVWIRKTGGAWVNSGDPAAGTGAAATLSGSGALYAFATANRASGVNYGNILRSEPGDISGTVPSGFTAAQWVQP